jgi:transposase
VDDGHSRFRANEVNLRLETIPGIGGIVATAIAAKITVPSEFGSDQDSGRDSGGVFGGVFGRDLAAWIGLVPRQYWTGDKDKIGKISKQGDGDLRRTLKRLLVLGATDTFDELVRRLI